MPAHLRYTNDITKNNNKRGRGQNNNTISMDDSALALAPKKHKEDQSFSLTQMPTTSTQNEDEDLHPINIFRDLRNKIRGIPIHLSDNAKHLIPNGKRKFRTNISVENFSHLLKNNDIILDGQTRNEFLAHTETILSGQCGDLELSAELNYSGPRTLNRMMSTSQSEADF